MNKIARALLGWYARNGRAHLPWRKTRDPYRILVSEFMLQQTQVARVLPKYRAFLKRFPNMKALASATRADVVREWRGLGYNSRALRLHEIARVVCAQYHARLPSDREGLLELPGIGPYTASAIRAFAFNLDDVAIDTNVRRIMQRAEIGSVVPRGRGHDWNSALMDLGSTICTARAPSCDTCPLRRYCAAAPVGAIPRPRRKKHSELPFELTARFARGRIVDRLRELPSGKTISLLALERELAWMGRSRAELHSLVGKLAAEGLVRVRNRQVALDD